MFGGSQLRQRGGVTVGFLNTHSAQYDYIQMMTMPSSVFDHSGSHQPSKHPESAMDAPDEASNVVAGLTTLASHSTATVIDRSQTHMIAHLAHAVAFFLLAVVFMVLNFVYSASAINMSSFVSISMHATNYEILVYPVEILLGMFSGGSVITIMNLVAALACAVNGLSTFEYYYRVTAAPGRPSSLTGRFGVLFRRWQSYPFAEIGVHQTTYLPLGLVFALGTVLASFTFGMVNVEGLVAMAACPMAGVTLMSLVQAMAGPMWSGQGHVSIHHLFFMTLGVCGLLVPWGNNISLVAALVESSTAANVPVFFWPMLIIGAVAAFLFALPAIGSLFTKMDGVVVDVFLLLVTMIFTVTIGVTFFPGAINQHNIDQISGIMALIASGPV